MSEILKIAPNEIEKRSFEIISKELGGRSFPPEIESIVKRVIHTTADFEYADTLTFSPDVVQKAKEALCSGAAIITDTKMAQAGINKRTAGKLGCEVYCFIGDEDVADKAKEKGVTRSSASMDKALTVSDNLIFAIGNAPTALIRLRELIDLELVHPRLIIGVPVGFVNVVPAKELILSADVPSIIARGRKGGSNVAAAICNALLYQIDQTRGS